ncbi:MAG: nucleotidyltransferase domain-containing protein [Coprothermobacterota bacterium]|nr:nucleotidyltransferase domain-containing protein [Coprothermobacterota bacterium]
MEIEDQDNRKQLLEDELQRYLHIFRSMPEAERVILFGSMADGPVGFESDIDLVVVMRSELSFWPRLIKLRRRLGPKVGLDLLVYSPEEFAKLCEERLFFRDEILTKGRVLYERAI